MYSESREGYGYVWDLQMRLCFMGILDYMMRNNSRCSKFLNDNVSKECVPEGLQHFYISMGSFSFCHFYLNNGNCKGYLTVAKNKLSLSWFSCWFIIL